MVECEERLGSRKTTADKDATIMETTWVVLGSNDELEVRQKVADTAPPIYVDSVESRSLTRREYSVEQVGYELWEATVIYARPDSNDPELSSFTFDTSGGTTHITQSFATQGYGDDPPDFKGAIGVTKDSVEGVDIIIPSLKFSETHPIPAALVTTGYVATLAGLTGKVNNAPWRGFPAESVLFVGAQGQSQSDGIVSTTFSFEVGQNATLTIAGISGIDKTGFQYVWTRYEDHADEDVNLLIKQPKWVFVETVYQAANFGVLGI